MRAPTIVCALLALVSLTACSQNESKTPVSVDESQAASEATAAAPFGPAATPQVAGGIAGRVLETMDTAGYTYARLQTADGEVWVAGPQTPLQIGDEVTGTNGMSMGAYHSQTLNRDFDNLYFVSAFSGPAGAAALSNAGPELTMPADHPPREKPEMVAVNIAPGAPGVLQIGDLFASAPTFNGQMVTVQGQVVKFNRAIMDRNWVHLQDGSGDPANGTHDLTLTTAETVQVGDVVKMMGTVAIDKDFGAGYSYGLLVENAQVLKQ